MNDRSDRGHRLLLASSARRWWIGVIALTVVVVPVVAASVSDQPTFLVVSGSAQLVAVGWVSVVAVLLATDVRGDRAQQGPALRAGSALAVATGVYGAAIAAAVVALGGAGRLGDGAAGLGVALAGVLVQLAGWGVGTVFGLGVGRTKGVARR